MCTTVYVDALILYYGAPKKQTRYKWLDLHALFKVVLQPRHDIRQIKYFTTRVSSTPNDPSKAQRQDAYLRALDQYTPNIQVYFGHFLRHAKRLPLVQPLGNQRLAEVIRTEEKGSDVNPAVHLLNDCWLSAYDCAVVVTNDSDIAEAMRLVRQRPHKRVGLVNPQAGRASHQLRQHADFVRTIFPRTLRQSQLPDPIPGTNLKKPAQW